MAKKRGRPRKNQGITLEQAVEELEIKLEQVVEGLEIKHETKSYGSLYGRWAFGDEEIVTTRYDKQIHELENTIEELKDYIGVDYIEVDGRKRLKPNSIIRKIYKTLKLY